MIPIKYLEIFELGESNRQFINVFENYTGLKIKIKNRKLI